MPKGTVRWFNQSKGYGFIRPEDGSCDLVVNIEAVRQAELNTLLQGELVSYKVEDSDGVLAAIAIEPSDTLRFSRHHH
jgi:CspA family cold shock protein